jgi:DNA-binding MarR family transcriptional regulator
MSTKNQLEQQVVLAARDYGISTVLFRHTVGARLGVNVTDMECLALLFFKRLATPTELSRYTGLSSGATTAMLNRLERAKLIERRPNPKDGRGSLITVNPASVSTVGPLFAGVRAAQDELLAGYSREQLDLIADFLTRYAKVWEDARPSLAKKPS